MTELAAQEWVLPPALAERARRFAAGEETPVAPRVAATVALLRPVPTGPGFEVYAIRRAATMAFAPGMYAFPGGSVDPRDADERWLGRFRQASSAEGEPPEDTAGWGTRLGLPPSRAWAVVSAAIREVAEESGVRLEAALLVPWARWVTPEFEPRRFDAYFFVAALPEGALTPAMGDEFDEAIWVRPAEAVDRYAAGEIAMLPPTIVTLRELTPYTSIAGALAAAADRDVATPVSPRVIFAPDNTAVLRY
jgi:8-oxo-dGTP pyrophosphatase MutT (NUDIX family)